MAGKKKLSHYSADSRHTLRCDDGDSFPGTSIVSLQTTGLIHQWAQSPNEPFRVRLRNAREMRLRRPSSSGNKDSGPFIPAQQRPSGFESLLRLLLISLIAYEIKTLLPSNWITSFQSLIFSNLTSAMRTALVLHERNFAFGKRGFVMEN